MSGLVNSNFDWQTFNKVEPVKPPIIPPIKPNNIAPGPVAIPAATPNSAPAHTPASPVPIETPYINIF